MPEGLEQQQQESQQEQQEQQEQQQESGGKPDGIPDALWGDNGFNADAFAQYRAPAADLPSSVDDYKLPAIEDVELDAADPLIGLIRKTALENGIGQEGFAGIVTEYAGALKAADDAAYEENMKALGDNAKGRVAAVSTWLDGILPKDEAEAVKAASTSAAAIKGLERLMNRKAPVAAREGDPSPPARKTREEIRALMQSKEYSGKPNERNAAVIKEVEDWYAEQARLDAEAGKAKEVTAR